MKNRNYHIVVMASLLLVISNLVQATTSVSQINVNSNATCTSVVTNAIQIAKVTSVPSGGGVNSVTVNGQVFDYTIGNSNGVTGNTLNFWTTRANSPNIQIKPVGFVILKTSNNSGDSDNSGNNGGRAFLFGNLGVLTDNIEIAPAKIIGITFCAAPLVTQGLAQCTSCPPENDPVIKARIVTQFDESSDPKKGWQVSACACGQFQECNPALPEGASVPDGVPGPCAGPLPFLPIDITVGGESYYCTVINGSRRCYAKK